MSSLIKILPEQVVNKIAAGEVVERPASVVKELVENSIDAGATDIRVEIEQAGRRVIRVIDNGSGMSKADAQTAFVRHATSKIATDADLENIRTMGFRGEALSSIASVSRIRLITMERDAASGALIEIEGGTLRAISDTAAPHGTSIEINHLFYNTPARLKFLKSPVTEFTHIVNAVSRQALAHPHIRFMLSHHNKSVFDLPSSQSIKERLFQLYGKEISDNLLEFSGTRDRIRVYGLIGRPAYTRSDRTYQDFYVNHRAVKNLSLTHALYGAYSGMLMRDRHPVGFVFIELDPALVDVNVHPAKTEVRFRNQSQMHDLVWDVLREGLRTQGVKSVATPAAGSGETSGGVREAVLEYVQGQSSLNVQQTTGTSSPFYGRRKRDLAPAVLQYDLTASGHRAPSGEPVEINGSMVAPSLFPLAQLHDSYILAQSRDGLEIIDQHAAHERILFEKLLDQNSGGDIPVQNLLIPVQVELGMAESGLLAEYLPELERIGFTVEDFGRGTFIIKAVPSLLVGVDYRKLLGDILDEVVVHGKSGKIDELRHGMLSVLACHPAIKINRHLDFPEMETLLNSLAACRMPHTCPHGRPTVIRFSMEEIRKMFKRT